MAEERIINYNKRLYGPGPVLRNPAGSGFRGYYGRMTPLRGFSMCAFHATIMGITVGMGYKFLMGAPRTNTINKYYEENPPR